MVYKSFEVKFLPVTLIKTLGWNISDQFWHSKNLFLAWQKPQILVYFDGVIVVWKCLEAKGVEQVTSGVSRMQIASGLNMDPHTRPEHVTSKKGK